jgi:hypothetical protein
MRKDYRLGAIVGVYILFQNNSFDERGYSEAGGTNRDYAIGSEITKVIIEEVFNSLTEFKNQDPLLIRCELEVIGLFGSRDDIRSVHRIGILKNLLTD